MTTTPADLNEDELKIIYLIRSLDYGEVIVRVADKTIVHYDKTEKYEAIKGKKILDKLVS